MSTLQEIEAERDKARADCAQLVADYGERGDLLAECRVRVSELEALLAECETALGDCATDISEWVEAHYAKIKHHPSETRRYERDMVSVDRARALLAKLKARTS